MRAWVAMLLACVLLGPSDAHAQDWDKRYRNWRTAGYLSFAGPAAGLGTGVLLINEAKDAPPLIDIVLVGMGIGLATTGVASGTPMMSLSADRGRYVLRQQGLDVSAGWNTTSWVGTGVATTGVGLIFLAAPTDINGLVAVGFLGALLGGTTAYVGGIGQWGVNRKARMALPVTSDKSRIEQGLRPTMIRVGGAW